MPKKINHQKLNRYCLRATSKPLTAAWVSHIRTNYTSNKRRELEGKKNKQKVKKEKSPNNRAYSYTSLERISRTKWFYSLE